MAVSPDNSIAPESFRGRVLRAGAWSLALQGADRLLGLARTILLARLLAPDDIGLFAIAAIAFNLLETFSRTGFRSALIQKEQIDRRDLDAAWTVHVIRGCFRACLLWIAAPFIAEFYASPDATSLVRVLSVLMVLDGFKNIGTVYFRKDLHYHKQVLIEFGGRVVDLVTVVILAIILGNAWALVWGLAAHQFFQFVLSYLIHPYRPRPCLSPEALRPLVGFGMWMSLTGVVVFMGRQSAGAVLGKVIDIKALGIYQMAFLIAQAAILDPVMAVVNVAFPALSRLRQDLKRFPRFCLVLIGLSSLVVMPLSTLVSLAAEGVAVLLLDEVWLPIVPPLRVLAMALMVTAMATLCEPIFLASGRPRNMFWAQLCRAVMVIITVYPLTRWAETAGAAFAMLCGGCGMLGVAYVFVRRTVSFQPGEISGVLLPPLLGCAAAAVAWALTALSLPDVPMITGLVAKTLAGLTAYGIVYKLSQPLNNTGIDAGMIWRVVVQRKSL